jgi:hypothetical protein
LFVFQYNLTIRIANTCQFLVLNLTLAPDFDFVLPSKLNWSKNVDYKCDAPSQIVIGTMDNCYCARLVLAVQPH